MNELKTRIEELEYKIKVQQEKGDGAEELQAELADLKKLQEELKNT